MAEWIVIVKNVSASDQWLTDFGTLVPSGGQVNLTDIATYDEIGGSKDLKQKITDDIFIINDGSQDLSKAASLDFVTLENIDDVYQNFYTQAQLASGGGIVHWDNIINAPSFGAPTWKDPVLARALEIQTPAPVSGMVEGDWYIDTSDNVLYQYLTSTWTAQLTASDGDRAIDLSETVDNDQSIFVLSGGSWVPSGDPVDGDAVVVLNDTTMDEQAQYVYEAAQQKWIKIGDINFGPHLDGGANKHDASEIDVENTYTNFTGAQNLESTLGSIDLELTDINSAVSTNAGNISTLQGEVSQLQTDVSSISGDLADNYTEHVALSAAIDQNTSDIASINLDTAFLSGAIDQNATDITDLQADTVFLSGAIDDNTTLITNLSAGLSANHIHFTDHVYFPSEAATPHIRTLEDHQAHVQSSYISSGFELTDNFDGSVDIAAGTVVLRQTTDVHTSTLVEYDAPSATVNLTNNETNYVFVQYNGGSPNFVVYTEPPANAGMTNQPLYFITRIGTTIHYVDMRTWSHDYAVKNSLKDYYVYGYEHKPGGSTLSESTSGGQGGFLDLTAGSFFLATVEHTHSAMDTSTSGDTFTAIYDDGGTGWTRVTDQHQIDFSNYDDGTGTLAPLSAGYYGVHWVYVLPDHTTDLIVVYGTGNYQTFAEAEAAGVPTQLPPEVDANASGQLVGKVVFQEGTTSINTIFTPFVDVLGSATTSTHNNLGGLQGGTTDEYYHFTQAEHDALNAHLDGTGSKHDASEIDVEGTYSNITGTPSDLETTISAIDTSLGDISSDTAFLSGAIDQNTSDISGLQTDVSSISADLANNYTEHVALSAAIDQNTSDIADINLDTAFLSGAIDTNTTNIGWLSGAIDAVEAGHNSLDEAYDFYGSGLGRTIVTDSGSVQLSAGASGYAPISLTSVSTAPTLGLENGSLAVINGVLCAYDTVRAKWLSVDRQFLVFGKDGTARSSYMKFYGGGATSNLSGLRLVRNATVVSLAGQLEEYQASQDGVFWLRKNDVLTNITGTSLTMNAVGVSSTSVNADLNANDYLQCWLEVSNPSWLINTPMLVVEIAWRF